jgi:hypothetical protein
MIIELGILRSYPCISALCASISNDYSMWFLYLSIDSIDCLGEHIYALFCSLVCVVVNKKLAALQLWMRRQRQLCLSLNTSPYNGYKATWRLGFETKLLVWLIDNNTQQGEYSYLP